MLPPELTRPAPKAPGSFDRCVPLEQTLALIPQLRERYGITRIADITHLDRIGIPVVSAVIPESPDVISIYNGKGPTHESALAGAVMEAVERQAAAAPNVTVRTCDARTVLDAIDLDHRERPRAGATLEAVAAVDLLSGETIFAPLAMVQCPWWDEPVVCAPSTNGLASGNTLAEAVYHALSELLERHLYAVAHARGYQRPRAILSRFAGTSRTISPFIDDPVAVEIALPAGVPVIDELAELIRQAGLELHLRAYESEPNPLLIVATIADLAGGTSAAHSGSGCSLSPAHAAIRALTEAAQARACDFLGAREDLCAPDDADLPPYGVRRKVGVPHGYWYFDAPAPVRELHSFADKSSNDVAADILQLIRALREAGVTRVAIVDLSPDDLPFHVVRAIAPQLEGHVIGGPPGPAVRAVLDLDQTT